MDAATRARGSEEVEALAIVSHGLQALLRKARQDLAEAAARHDTEADRQQMMEKRRRDIQISVEQKLQRASEYQKIQSRRIEAQEAAVKLHASLSTVQMQVQAMREESQRLSRELLLHSTRHADVTEYRSSREKYYDELRQQFHTVTTPRSAEPSEKSSPRGTPRPACGGERQHHQGEVIPVASKEEQLAELKRSVSKERLRVDGLAAEYDEVTSQHQRSLRKSQQRLRDWQGRVLQLLQEERNLVHPPAPAAGDSADVVVDVETFVAGHKEGRQFLEAKRTLEARAQKLQLERSRLRELINHHGRHSPSRAPTTPRSDGLLAEMRARLESRSPER
jgi:hypothetical protein